MWRSSGDLSLCGTSLFWLGCLADQLGYLRVAAVFGVG